MIVNEKDILQFIPQRPPMVMVDTLLEYATDKAMAQLHLSCDNLFCKDGKFHAPGLIEHMAQTAALHAGYKAAQNGELPKAGVIGSIKRFTIYELPNDSDTLTSTVSIQPVLSNTLIVKGETFVEEHLIAKGELYIFLQT